MFCIYTLLLVRPAQAKIQMLTTSSWIVTILLKSLLKSLGLYLSKKKDSFLKWFIFTEQRSCSANQLDVIVDILGVPSDLLNQRDSNKRLFLLKANDKKETVLRRNRPRRSGTCKVKSGLGLAAPHGGAVGLGAEVGGHKGHGSAGGGGRGPRERPPPLQSGNKSKSCEDQEPQDLLMEVKRRSIYAKDCRLVVY